MILLSHDLSGDICSLAQNTISANHCSFNRWILEGRRVDYSQPDQYSLLFPWGVFIPVVISSSAALRRISVISPITQWTGSDSAFHPHTIRFT